MTIAGEARAAAAFLEGSPVPVLSTSVDPGDRQFSANSQRMRTLVEELQTALARVREGGGEAQVKRHRERGKLTARERIDHLLDAGTAFLELNPLAARGMYGDDAPGAGMVTGVGR